MGIIFNGILPVRLIIRRKENKKITSILATLEETIERINESTKETKALKREEER